jgi:hypothetical protein
MQRISEEIRDAGYSSVLPDILHAIDTASSTGEMNKKDRPIIEVVSSMMQYITLFFEGQLSPSLLSETDSGNNNFDEGVEKMISSTFSQRYFTIFCNTVPFSC